MSTLTRWMLAVILHPRIYRLGKREAFHGYGMTYDHPESLRSTAYDIGRNQAEVWS